MGRENSSVNFAVGIDADNFNFFDNDYIEPVVYRMVDTSKDQMTILP